MVVVSDEERTVLLRWSGGADAEPAVARRARVVLEAAGGRTNGEIARTLGVHAETVSRWRDRFAANRLEGLRRGAPRARPIPRTAPALVERVLGATLGGHAPGGRPWSTRSLARHLKTNHMAVHRIWQAYGLSSPPNRPTVPYAPSAPWIQLVGVYLGPPAAAAVFSVEQRPLVGGRPLAPAPPGETVRRRRVRPARDASRIAEVLDSAREAVPPIEAPRSECSHLLVFLRGVERRTPGHGQLSAVIDRPLDFVNERVGDWLRQHPRFRVYTPRPGESWSAAIEGWLARWQHLPLHPESLANLPSFLGWVSEGRSRVSAQPPQGSWSAGGPVNPRTSHGRA